MPGVEVWAYGSRVNGRSHDGSDLDLVLRGPALEPLDGGFYDLLEAIEKSNIPILIQAHDWAMLPESFHRGIERDYVVVQKGAKKAAAGEGREVTSELSESFPSHWRSVPFSDAVFFQEGPGIRNWQYRSAGIPFVNIRCLVDGRLDRQSMNCLDAEEVDNRYAHFLLDAGDYVVSSSGTIGRIAEVSQEDLPCMLNTSVIRMRPKAGSILDRRFLRYFLTSSLFQNQIESFATGSAQRNYGPMHLKMMWIVLPPLPEQRSIAHILGTLDDKIELNRRMNETLEEMARALFQSWFVDFEPVRAKMEGRWRRGESLPGLPAEHYDLFPERLVDSELGEVPEGWGVKGLGELVELAYGKALRAADRKGGPVPVYGSNGQVGWHDKGLVAGPGIVVGRKGNPGVVTWAHSDFFPIDTAFYVVPRCENEEMSFLFFALTSQELSSVSADSAVPGLNRNLAYMNRQLVPNQLIVDEFNDYVGAIFSRRHGLEEESRVLAAQRDVLLPRLVSGEMRVEEASTSLNTLAG